MASYKAVITQKALNNVKGKQPPGSGLRSTNPMGQIEDRRPGATYDKNEHKGVDLQDKFNKTWQSKVTSPDAYDDSGNEGVGVNTQDNQNKKKFGTATPKKITGTVDGGPIIIAARKRMGMK